MIRDTFITRDHVRLAARLRTPPGHAPFGCVVFVHGLGSDKDSPRNVVIAEALLDRGIASLLFDLSGHGDSTSDPRGAGAMLDDVTAAFRWVCLQAEIDPSRIGVAGSSMGATIALQAVGAGRVKPAALVLRCPPIEPGDAPPLDLPALVIIGSHDPLLHGVRTTVRDVPAYTLEVVEGAGHLFEEPGVLARATELTVEWFARHLAAAARVGAR